MKTMLAGLVALALVAVTAVPAFAYDITLTTNSTPTMVAPPAQVYVGPGLYALPSRTITNAYVRAGQVWRQGTTPIVAANTGYTTTSGTVVTNVIGGTTNITYRIASLTLPSDGGLTAVDGSVYWFVVPQSRTALLVQPTIAGGGTVTFSTDQGAFTEATTLTKTTLQGFSGAIYGNASTTNCSVKVMPW